MAKFKSFITAWLSMVVVISLFTVVGTQLLEKQDENAITNLNTNHFSVVYRGWIPDYSTDYPDYYICINDLKDDPLQMYIQLVIQNQEASGYYFRIEQYETPPAGWTIYPYDIGYIATDGTLTFTYSEIYRSKPTSIPAGELNETINLALKAYYDASYTNLYSQDNFTVSYHLIDRASPAWTVIEHNNFDDQTTQGWSGNGISVSTEYYRSFRYSLRSYSSEAKFQKTFSLAGYTEVYLICAIKSNRFPDIKIVIDGQTYFKPDVTPAPNTWYSFTIPLPVFPSSSPQLAIQLGYYSTTHAYMDDVYVIGR